MTTTPTTTPQPGQLPRKSAPSTTASLGYWTLALQAACLLVALIVYLVEHLHPGAVEGGTGLTAAQALQTIASVAVGGGAGGGLATVGHGVRHYGAGAPTSAQLQLQPYQQPLAITPAPLDDEVPDPSVEP